MKPHPAYKTLEKLLKVSGLTLHYSSALSGYITDNYGMDKVYLDLVSSAHEGKYRVDVCRLYEGRSMYGAAMEFNGTIIKL